MSQTTPFVRRMRTQSGTFYCFVSSVEDLGLNINERNNIVKMSHYALLDIPALEVPPTLYYNSANRFNVFAIPGAFKSWLDSGSIKDGRVIIAESFQNYALNFEANLLSQSTYNPALSTTVAERVFWKWMKETGAIRWKPIDTSAGTYWQEETDTDSSTNYESVVKCIGTISAGAVRTDTFGTYNETYVLVPTSFGQTPVYFKQVEDDNYYHTLSITNGATNILGRETYTKPHPDGLDFKAYYDLADSSTTINTYNMQYDDSVGSWSANYGSWWTAESLNAASNTNSYFIDASTYIANTKYNIDIKYDDGLGSTIQYRRSKVDCMSIEFDLDNLKTIFNDSTLTFDDLAITYSTDDSFDFNAVLVYYSVYNKALDKILATNLLGILFLDAPSGNTSGYPANQIVIPSITKLQSGANGFGTSYSFRINIKSDYILDDTQAIVTDTTASQQVLSDFGEVFDNLGKTLSILNQQTGTLSYITEQYLDITTNQTNIENQISDLQYQVNDIARDITGTENAIAMFSDGDDPLIDSSIYMKNGKLGFFTNDPTYPAQFDVSVKVKDLIIENAIRDTSGNILIGYGSPLQIGSSTGTRDVVFYSGAGVPAMTINTSSNIVIDTSVTFTQVVYLNASLYSATGDPISGAGDVTKAYTDGSLATRDGKITSTDTSVSIIRGTFIPSASLGTGLSWIAGKIYVDVSVAGGTVTSAYVDGSLATAYTYVDASLVKRDTSIAVVYPMTFKTNSSIAWLDASIKEIYPLTFKINSSIAWLDASIKQSYPLVFVSNTSIGVLTSSKADVASPTFTGTPAAPTATGVYTYTTQIATTEFSERRARLLDTSITLLNTRRLIADASITFLESRRLISDTSISAIDTSVKSLYGGIVLGSWKFMLSGNNLVLKYGDASLFKFTTDGSILAIGKITENASF